MVIIFLISLNHCNKNEEIIEIKENNIQSNVKFINIKSIDISNIIDLRIHLHKNEVWVYGSSIKNEKQILLEIYDQDFKLISTKIFNKGQGPGDLGNGVLFFAFDSFIYAPDNTQKRINIFDKNFKFIKFKKLLHPFLPILFVENGHNFLATELFYIDKRIGYRINIVTFQGLIKKHLFEFGPYNYFEKHKVLVGENPGFHYFHYRKKLYFINMKSYTIDIYNLKGKIEKSIKLKTEIKRVPFNKKSIWLKEQAGSFGVSRGKLADFIQPASWMVPLEKGFVVVKRDSYSTECSGLVQGDYFNYQLELKGKVKLPCFLRIFHLTRGYFPRTFAYKKGFFFLVNEINGIYKLEKWKVIE